jgi:hypothetical protein
MSNSPECSPPQITQYESALPIVVYEWAGNEVLSNFQLVIVNGTLK